jgi:branched-subunit amino acid ABC-type transport system permease component
VLEFINFYLTSGLVVGSIYALGAVGITLIFGVLRFAHFAHGDMMTFGAFVALAAVQGLGLPVLAALPMAVAAVAVLAVGLDRVFYRHLRGGHTIVILMAAFGVALMLRSAVQVYWGTDAIVYVKGIQRPMVFEGFRLFERHIYIVGGTALLMTGLHLFLSRSKLGKAMRAMADNEDLARLSGIATEKVVVLTWVIGGGFAAAAGVFMAMDGHLESMMGWSVLLPMFAAAILGGLGKPVGAVLGGLIIGLSEELSTYPWIGDQPLLEPAYKTAVAFAILVALLIWRPTGLLGRKTN